MRAHEFINEMSQGHWTSEQFMRWFNGSKIIDSDGNPMVLYHGTDSRFDSFRPSPRGNFGSGIYFGDSKSAKEYGTYVVAAYLRMVNPYVTVADYDIGDEYDLDSPAIPMILSLFDDKDEAMQYIDAAKEDDGYFGKEITNILKSEGYDGIVAKYNDGSMEYIVFNPNQIKSAVENVGDYSLDTDDYRK